MKSLIKRKLHEALSIPSFSMPKNVEVNDQILQELGKLTWRDITVDNTGDNGHDTLFFDIKFANSNLNYLSEGIKFTIQLLYDTYYQPHMFMAPSIQGKGLAPKIFKSFIMEYGHIYAGFGRTVNNDATKMLSKLENDPDFEVVKGKHGLLIMKKGNEDRETLLKIVS